MKKSQNKNKECKAGQYKTNEVVTHGPLICVGGFGQPPCKYYKECRAEMLLRTKKSKSVIGHCRNLNKKCNNFKCILNITEADRTGKWNLKKEVFNEGLDGFPEEHI